MTTSMRVTTTSTAKLTRQRTLAAAAAINPPSRTAPALATRSPQATARRHKTLPSHRAITATAGAARQNPPRICRSNCRIPTVHAARPPTRLYRTVQSAASGFHHCAFHVDELCHALVVNMNFSQNSSLSHTFIM